MPTKFKFLFFFAIIFLSFFTGNNLVFGFSCSTPDYCPATVTRRSWSCADTWHECGTGSFGCATGATCSDDCCAGGPPLVTPTPLPTQALVCPVNAGCCYSPLTGCTANNQCPANYRWCYAGICVKENYNPGTNTCSAAIATPTLRPTLPAATPTPPSAATPTWPPGSVCQVTGVSASDGQYPDRIYIAWTVANGNEAQRIDLYQGTTYLTSQSATDPGQWHFNHQNLTCPLVNNYVIYCWKDGRLYGQATDAGSTLCPTPTGRITLTPTPTPRLSPTPTPTSRWPSPTPPVAYGAWFQSQDGDAHAQGNISDPMSPFPAKIFSLNGDGGFPGVVSFRGSTYFGSGAISAKDWLAKTGFVLRNFHFYYAFLKSPQTISFNGNMPAGDGVYFADSDQTITDNWQVAGGKRIIILVNGNVKILGNIVVPYGSALVLIAAGNINFGDQVVQAQGIFLADKKISTGSGASAFAGEGSFVAGQEMILGRDFADGRNRLAPVEKFLFRPDLIVNSPRDLWSTSHVWEELAP